MNLCKMSFMAAAMGYLIVLKGGAWAQKKDENGAVAEANFESADTNSDGGLDRDEFKVFINANAESNLGRAKQIRRFRAYGRAFSRLDADENKSVTWEEIQIAQSGE